MTLLQRIENHLKAQDISATRFGRMATGDPRFVLDLRMGRKPRRKTTQKLEDYLAAFEDSASDANETAINSPTGSAAPAVQIGEQLPATARHRHPRPSERAGQSARQ